MCKRSTSAEESAPPARKQRSFGEASLSAALPEVANELKILTLNVHGWHHADDSSWLGLVAMLTAVDPDVIALQEATKHRVPALATALGGFYWTVRHNCAILSRFELTGLEAGQSAGVGLKNLPQRKQCKQEAGKRFSTATISPRPGLVIDVVWYGEWRSHASAHSHSHSHRYSHRHRSSRTGIP